MKICFITNDIFELGGVQRVVSVLADKLTEEHEVTVLCTKETKINRELYNISTNLKIDIQPNIFKTNIFSKFIRKVIKEINQKIGVLNKEKYCKYLAKIYYPKKITNNFIKYFSDNNYDVIIGVEGIYSILLGYIYNEIDSKLIGWQHNSYDAYLKNKNRYYWNLDILFEKYVKRLDKYIVLTEYDRVMFKKEKKIECNTIANPRSFISEEKSTLEKKQFLAAGRFTYQKGFDLLIESFNLFSKKNSEWNLVIVGEGEEKEKIKGLIDKYSLQNRIRIDSFTDNIQSYFLDSSALLLSSRWEGMPMIVLESLEMGVPIISYDISAIEPLVTDRKEGVIIEKYDVEKFSNAMNEIVNNKFRKYLGANCTMKSDEFGIDQIIRKWNNILLDESCIGE